MFYVLFQNSEKTAEKWVPWKCFGMKEWTELPFLTF
jgi:hypothetical protein